MFEAVEIGKMVPVMDNKGKNSGEKKYLHVGTARKTEMRENVECPRRNLRFIANPGDYIIELPSYTTQAQFKAQKDGKPMEIEVEGDKFVVNPNVFHNSYVRKPADESSKQS